MVFIAVAYTSPINPPSASPTLNRAQIWKGLQRKVYFAQEFVSVIESCEVIKDEAGVVERVVRFKEGTFVKREAREWVREIGDGWVDFEQEDGTHIRNIVSEGAEGGLYMTYTFEFKFPDLKEGSTQAAKETEKLKAMAKKAVDSSIETIRAMVLDGRISTA
ncbi:DUF1857-domain-containing protein [Byssothecium circinans]|uniref:DUF1857-domain-containing protein n=1 Tax=Byssothecium circinans TaxID=147558 RepID=A0A6A5U5P6_9PLEO|nr:DUF1857-domain-containing protein [Byssothecium circinans]